MTGSSSEEVVLVAVPGSAAVRGGLGGVAVRGCDILAVLWGCGCTYLEELQ